MIKKVYEIKGEEKTEVTSAKVWRAGNKARIYLNDDTKDYSVYRFEGHVSPDRYRVTRRMLDLHSFVMDRDNEIYNLYDLFKRMEEEEEHIRRRKNRLAKIVFGMARF